MDSLSIRSVALTRQARKLAADRVAAIQHQIEHTPLWLEFIEAKTVLGEIDASVADAESELRAHAIEAYKTTDEKVFPGCKVKTYTVLSYNPDEAIDFCAEHLRKALNLNKREFEKVAKVMEPNFVTITQEPRVYIDSDLSEFEAVVEEPSP